MMWDEYGQCRHCKNIIAKSSFASSFFFPICPKCGADNDMEIVVAKEVYVGKWYNPLTWLKFEWKIRK